MGEVHDPRRVTPIAALLAAQADWFDSAKPPLEKLFGAVELESPFYDFDRTDYYTESMGPDLKRRFFTFRSLADPGSLVAWKLACNRLEIELKAQFAASGAVIPERPINIDPGYLTGAKLVLASTKDFAHRIYLRDGIFAEITMGFRGDSWVSHDFTFPDFKSRMYDEFLKKARDWHLRKVKQP
jgi:hypothetical protein